jgi:hypothetical protein
MTRQTRKLRDFQASFVLSAGERNMTALIQCIELLHGGSRFSRGGGPGRAEEDRVMRGRATSNATIGPIVTNSRYCNHNQLFGCIRWSFFVG